MESNNSSGSDGMRLNRAERQEILEHIYRNLVSLIATYCPNLDPNLVNEHLRNIDFGHLDGPERTIIADLLPQLTAALMPPETEEEGNIWHTFDADIGAAEVNAGGLQLLNEDGIPDSEEHLRAQTAVLRATTIFARENFGIDCHGILLGKIRYALCEMIIKTGHALPSVLLRKLNGEEKGLLEIVTGLEQRGESHRIQERDKAIEREMQSLGLPPEIAMNKPEEVHKIRDIIRNSIWKAWGKRERIIKEHKMEKFIAIRQFMRKYQNLSILVPWLLGETN